MRWALPVIIGIGACCVVLDPLITHGLVFRNPSFGASKVHRLFEEEHPREIPILGSSRADGSYVPALIHPDAWNYGIEKTGHRVTSILLAQEIKRNKDTPIIINYDHNFFDDGEANAAHFIPELRHAELRTYLGDRLRWFHRLPTVRYFGVMDEYTKALVGLRNYDPQAKGATFLREQFDAQQFRSNLARRSDSKFHWTPSPMGQAWIDQLASTPRTIHIVVAPYHPSWFEVATGMESANAYLARMDALPNVDVIDLSTMALPDSCFRNTTHVNFNGAVVFSTELGTRLRAIEQHR